MWIVWDWSEGLVGVYEKHYEAFNVYEELKALNKEIAQSECDLNGEERLILAKVEKQFYSFDTKKKMPVYFEGKEVYSPYTYWDFKEESF